MSFTTHTLSIRGTDISYRRSGDGSPVIFVHGVAGVLAWSPFFDRIATNYEIIVPDLPGFGASDTPEWLDNVEDMAYFLLEFLEATGNQAAHVVAHSFGGWVTAEAAVRSPGSFESISFLAPAGVRSIGVAQPDIFSWNPPQLVKNLFHNERFVNLALSTPPTQEQRDVQEKNAATAARLAQRAQLYNPNLARWLHRIECPVLLVWGEDDNICPTAYSKTWCEHLPNVELKMFEKCGHLPQVEQVELCGSEVSKFLARVKL